MYKDDLNIGHRIVFYKMYCLIKLFILALSLANHLKVGIIGTFGHRLDRPLERLRA